MKNVERLAKSLRLKSLRSRTPALGERELAVLDVLWREPDLTPQVVHASMPEAGVTLNTVQSTLERLHRKGLLLRSKQARSYHYAVKQGRDELISSLMRDISSDIAGGELLPMLSGFVRYLSEDDPETLDRSLAELGLTRQSVSPVAEQSDDDE